MAKSPQGFIVVLPGEIIEIAQDDDISWLTLFYALPKELAEKYPDALKIPRSPYEVLYEGSYGAVAKSDMLKMLVWVSRISTICRRVWKFLGQILSRRCRLYISTLTLYLISRRRITRPITTSL